MTTLVGGAAGGIPFVAHNLSAFRAGVDTFHALNLEEGAADRDHFQERMLQRFLTQSTGAPKEDIDYLLEKMDRLAAEKPAAGKRADRVRRQAVN